MMKRTISVFSLIILLSAAVYSQVEKGSLNEAAILQIMETFKDTPENRAVVNAITHNDIKTLSINRENDGKLNDYFSNEIKTTAITNQKSSGRCWLYTGLNTLRPLVKEKYKLHEFEFSQTYNFFWDQLEKANLFMEIAIATADKPMDDREVEWLFKNPIGDGGQWTTFADIVTKYGLVPAEAMPNTFQSENTSAMSGLISQKLRENGLKLRKMTFSKISPEAQNQAKLQMLSEIYRILVLTLGEPPKSFVWQFKDKDGNISEPKTYTPKEFYTEIIGIDLSGYVMLMNDPTRAYEKLYEVEFDRNLVEGANWKYINLPAEKLKEFAKKSIVENEALYFSCDVGKQLDSKNGTLDLNNYDYESLFGVEFGMDKKARIQTFASGSTHGMALVGVNILPDNTTDKWLLENSWGADKGKKGFLIMTDEWFSEYAFRLIVNKKYIDTETLKILDQEPVMLPPWDPVFEPEL
jgi:bleomycin hydrolase